MQARQVSKPGCETCRLGCVFIQSTICMVYGAMSAVATARELRQFVLAYGHLSKRGALRGKRATFVFG